MKQTLSILTGRKRNIMTVDHQVGNNREILSEKKSMKRETRIIITITKIRQTEAVLRGDGKEDMSEADNLSDRMRGISEWLQLSEGLS